MSKTYLGISLLNFAVAALTGGLTALVCGCAFAVMALTIDSDDDEE